MTDGVVIRAENLTGKFYLYMLSYAFLFALCISANAQTSILPENPYSFSGFSGNAAIEPVSVTGQSFTQAYRLTVNGSSARISDALLSWQTTQPIAAGDRLQLTLWVRKLAPLDGHNIRSVVTFESVNAPQQKLLSTVFPCDSETWTKYIIPFKATSAYGAGEARLTFQFAFGPQTFELGGLSLTNSGPTPPLSTQSTTVIPENSIGTYFSYFDQNAGGGSAVRTAVSGQPFAEAISITTNGTSDFLYRAGVGWRNTAAIAKDEVLLLQFYLRKLEPVDSSSVRGQVVFERASGDFAKSLIANYPVDDLEWHQFQIPFKASTDLAVNAAQLVFQMAAGPQKFEIGGVSLLNFGKAVDLTQLPNATFYPGRGNPNQQWLIEARNRINQLRKGDLTVIVRDPRGALVPRAEVFIQQTNHAYRFGSAVTAARITGSGADNEIYRSRISSHFTTSVFENDLKWPLWECTNCGSSFNKPNTRSAIAWLAERNIQARGHNLIWPSWQYSPSDLPSLSADALRQRIDLHFANILTDSGVNGKLYHWDVLNEPYANYDVQGRIAGVSNVAASNGVLGNQEMIRWFQIARQLEPNAKLFINDYNILEAGGADINHQNYFHAVCKWLLDSGAPLDGIGIQGHFGGITTIPTMQAIIDRYAQLGVPLAITEYDFNTSDEDLQADFTRDFMTLIFSQPQFDDFLIWGFWERAHWLPLGAMYRADWSSKKNALVWNDLLFNEWWTNVARETDSNGRLTVRGFKGTYHITVKVGREQVTVPITLGESATTEIVIEPVRHSRPVSRRSAGRRIAP
jgi:GH35 family endo-1,4-beta-xylanase